MSIKQNTFKQVGNLAFYDGWHPNYVYFKSLLNAGEYYATGTGPRQYNPSLANPIAQRAINDANSHSTLIADSPKDSMDDFSDKFQKIIAFLRQAYNYERRNEILYFEQKIEDLESNFSREELEKISILKEFYTTIKTAYGSHTPDFDYKRLITLINVLQQGFKNTEVIAQHEENRIKQIEDTIDNLIKSRMKQTKGLKQHYKNDLATSLLAGVRSGRRLKQRIFVEYASHAQLTRKENGKYVLFGGATFEKKIEKTVSTTLAHWINDIMAELINDTEIIKKIVEKLNVAYQNKFSNSTSGQFFALEQEAREIIIQGVCKYAIDNLGTVLSKELNQDLISEVKTAMISNKGRQIFDMVSHYDIHGLNNSWGLKGNELDLFKNAQNTADMAQNKATELFNAIQTLLNSVKSAEKEYEDKSFLIQTLENSHKYIRVQDLINLINRVETIQEESKKLEQEYIKQEDKAQKLIKTLTLSENNNTLPITITIENGEVNVDMDALLKALHADPVFQSMNFKTFNPQKLKTTITTLKGRASLELKNILIDSINSNAASSISSSMQEYIGIIRQELEQLEIKIKGPSMAEMLTNIHFTTQGKNIYIDWTGGINGKNDQVTVTIRHNKAVNNLKTNLSPKVSSDVITNLNNTQSHIEELQLQFMKHYQELIDTEVGRLTRNNITNKYSSMIPYISTNVKDVIMRDQNSKERESQSEDLQKIYDQLDTEVQKFIKLLHEQGVDKEKLTKIENQLLNPFKNSFQVSNTVKSYDTYVNDIGFTGGSLGTNLDEQLDRINDIFTTAGAPITVNDMSWLRSAIINCFPGSIVQEKNKNLIEQYLGAVMVFALFDEGGAESAIISDYYKEYLADVSANSSNAQILHLYYVNGVYVPGSYVLLQTITALENDVLPNLEKVPTLMRQGAGITIINPASEADISNRPIAKTSNPDINAWGTTGQAIASKVRLKILFLAGLLDIVNSINTTLSNIGK